MFLRQRAQIDSTCQWCRKGPSTVFLFAEGSVDSFLVAERGRRQFFGCRKGQSTLCQGCVRVQDCERATQGRGGKQDSDQTDVDFHVFFATPSPAAHIRCSRFGTPCSLFNFERSTTPLVYYWFITHGVPYTGVLCVHGPSSAPTCCEDPFPLQKTATGLLLLVYY